MFIHQIISILININWQDICYATLTTIVMIFAAITLTVIIGFPLGIVLFVTSKNGLLPNKIIYIILAIIVNILRSIPFIILLIAMIPFTNLLVGTSLGTLGVIPPLIFGAFPFFARLIETSLNNINKGVITMAYGYGASTFQIIRFVLIPEVIPDLISGITITLISLVSYSAMAGVVGGGGLGDLAIRYGYQRFEPNIMLITVVIMVFIVQIIQSVGSHITNKLIR